MCASVTVAVLATLTIGGPAVILLLMTAIVIVMGVKKPEVAFVAAITVGVGNGALRRIAGWIDPSGIATQIVPIIPAVILVTLYVSLLVIRRNHWTDKAPIAFVLVCIVVIISGINPAGVGIVNNLLASSLLISGILAFILTFRRLIPHSSVINTLAVVGSINAAYMILQEINGLTPWDAYWVDNFGYSALYLGPNLVRPLGLGASAAESAAICAMLVGVSVARLRVSRNPAWLVPISLGLYAALTSGTRTFALPALAVILLGFAIGRKRPMLVGLVTLAVTLPVIVVIAGRLMPAVSSAGAGRVLMLVSGSESEETSTVGIHQDLILSSLLRGLSSVIGTGSGQVSVLASGGLGSSEQDISNMALIGGVLGVVAMLALYITFARAIPGAFRDLNTAPFLFITFATIGQWMNVGYYGATPLIWASLGVVLSLRTKETKEYALDTGRKRSSRD
ncbi:hypothetical protein DEA06_15910 [Microbacterium sp. Gd 4-13]|nr:hypothetical protein DEA06_15910 [Microbacterium sp. Gd 4-13]